MGYPTFRAGPFDYGKYGPAEDLYGVQDILDQAFEESHTAELENGFVVYSKSVRLNKSGDTKTIYLYFPNTEHTLTHGGRTAVTQSELAQAHIGSKNKSNGKWGTWFRGVLEDVEVNVFDMLESTINGLLTEEVKKARRLYREVINRPNVKAELAKQKGLIADADARVKELTKTRDKLEAKIRELRSTDYHALADKSGIKLMKMYQAFITKAQISTKERIKTLKRSLENTKEAIRKTREEAASLRRQERAMRPAYFKRYVGDEISEMVSDINDKIAKVPDNSQAARDLAAVRRAIQHPFSMGFGGDKAVERAAEKARNQLHACLIGHKAPPLAERTKKNRERRGYDDTPLKETREFADSLMWEVK